MKELSERLKRESPAARERRLKRGRQRREENKAQHYAMQKRWVEKNREKVRGYQKAYRDGHRGEHKEYRAEHKQRHQAYHLKAKYGLDLAGYNAMLSAQGGTCKICGGPPTGRYKRFAVDHNHQTGVVRGLLCDECNHLVGRMQDDSDLVRAAADYLRSFQNKRAGEAR